MADNAELHQFVAQAHKVFAFLYNFHFIVGNELLLGDTCSITWKSVDVYVCVGISSGSFEQYIQFGRIGVDEVDFGSSPFGLGDILKIGACNEIDSFCRSCATSFLEYVGCLLQKCGKGLLEAEDAVYREMDLRRYQEVLHQKCSESDKSLRDQAHNLMRNQNFENALISYELIQKKTELDVAKIRFCRSKLHNDLL